MRPRYNDDVGLKKHKQKTRLNKTQLKIIKFRFLNAYKTKVKLPANINKSQKPSAPNGGPHQNHVTKAKLPKALTETPKNINDNTFGYPLSTSCTAALNIKCDVLHMTIPLELHSNSNPCETSLHQKKMTSTSKFVPKPVVMFSTDTYIRCNIENVEVSVAVRLKLRKLNSIWILCAFFAMTCGYVGFPQTIYTRSN